MSLVGLLSRLLIVAVLATGLVPPEPVMAQMAAAGPVAQDCHEIAAIGTQVPQDELCRQHCQRVSLPETAVAPEGPVERVARLRTLRADEDGPSRWPPPEGRPPRI